MSDSIFVIPRINWDAAMPNVTMPKLQLPIQKVLLLDTHTSECSNKFDCTHLLRTIQIEEIKNSNGSDLNYNFVIGGDGLTYEARGWNYGCELKNYSDPSTLVVGLMG